MINNIFFIINIIMPFINSVQTSKDIHNFKTKIWKKQVKVVLRCIIINTADFTIFSDDQLLCFIKYVFKHVLKRRSFCTQRNVQRVHALTQLSTPTRFVLKDAFKWKTLLMALTFKDALRVLIILRIKVISRAFSVCD